LRDDFDGSYYGDNYISCMGGMVMCKRPSQVLPEVQTQALIEQKGNLPSALYLRVLVKPCACGQGWVGRSEGNDVWMEAEFYDPKNA